MSTRHLQAKLARARLDQAAIDTEVKRLEAEIEAGKPKIGDIYHPGSFQAPFVVTCKHPSGARSVLSAETDTVTGPIGKSIGNILDILADGDYLVGFDKAEAHKLCDYFSLKCEGIEIYSAISKIEAAIARVEGAKCESK